MANALPISLLEDTRIALDHVAGGGAAYHTEL